MSGIQKPTEIESKTVDAVKLPVRKSLGKGDGQCGVAMVEGEEPGLWK